MYVISGQQQPLLGETEIIALELIEPMQEVMSIKSSQNEMLKHLGPLPEDRYPEIFQGLDKMKEKHTS